MKRGRPSNLSGEQPSEAFYKCPVDTCTYGKIRGDDISRHFQRFANLDIVDNATEHFSNLRTQKSKEASDTIELSDEYLNFLLTNVSNLERLHSKYLFQNGHTSSNLPNCDSKNFKCQQKKKPIPSWVQVGQKRAKSDETLVPSTSTSISQLNLEPKSHESSEATIIDTDKVENESGEKNIETELHSENEDVILDDGQLISKCLFCLQFSQKMNENNSN